MSKDHEEAQAVTLSHKPAEISRSAPAGYLQPLEEFERFFDRIMRRGWLRSFGGERPLWSDLFERFEIRVPRVDVIDRDADVLVRAEVPGVDKNDLDVSMADNTLTINGTVGGEVKETTGDQFYRCEIARGAFSRSVTIPANVDLAQADATLKDGVLEIVLPKKESSKRKAIPVK
jgi:HSP20 family protein